MSGEIVLQINVRRTSTPPFYETTIDKYPEDPLEHLNLLNQVMVGCKYTIDQFTHSIQTDANRQRPNNV